MAEGAAEAQARTRWARYRVVLFFLAGLVAVDCAVASRRHVWRAYDPDDYRVKVHDCRRQRRDLVIAGGSPVADGIDPAVLVGASYDGGSVASAYNLGLSGATTSEVWHAVAHGLRTPPRLLVYGITASDVNDGRDEPHGPRSLMDAGDVLDWARLRPKAAQWCVRHYALGRLGRAWNLFHYRNGIRLWAADAVEQLRPGTCPEAAEEAAEGLRYTAALHRGDGFAPRPEFQAGSLTYMKALGKLPQHFPFLEKYRVGGHLRYLHRILDWAERHGVTVVLLDMPVSADLEKMHAPAFALYRAALAEVERSRGVRVLRATRPAVGLGDDDFADPIHLNAAGAAKLSAWLRNEIER